MYVCMQMQYARLALTKKKEETSMTSRWFCVPDSFQQEKVHVQSKSEQLRIGFFEEESHAHMILFLTGRQAAVHCTQVEIMDDAINDHFNNV